jgi:hypothetical protein
MLRYPNVFVSDACFLAKDFLLPRFDKARFGDVLTFMAEIQRELFEPDLGKSFLTNFVTCSCIANSFETRGKVTGSKMTPWLKNEVGSAV